MSLGIVQDAPTQFDEPLYRYMANEAKIAFVVYYYGKSGCANSFDPEIGRHTAWDLNGNGAYKAELLGRHTPIEFARKVTGAGHALLIVSGYSQRQTLYTAIMGKLRGVPVGLRSDNVLPHAGGSDRYWRIKSLLYPIMFKLYTTGHPVGEQAAKYLMTLGFKENSLFTFPYSIDHQWFAQESSVARVNAAALRNDLGLSQSDKVICAVIKFSEREDPLTLIRAFLLIRETNPNVSLLLVGDGPLRDSIQELAGSELGKKIILRGYVKYTDLPRIYAVSDLFIHTAKGPWEVSVGEALACGLPVISSDAVGSAKELIEPLNFGRSFIHGDANSLARQIEAALSDASLFKRTHENGAGSLEKWGVAATAERIRDALEYASFGSR